MSVSGVLLLSFSFPWLISGAVYSGLPTSQGNVIPFWFVICALSVSTINIVASAPTNMFDSFISPSIVFVACIVSSAVPMFLIVV